MLKIKLNAATVFYKYGNLMSTAAIVTIVVRVGFSLASTWIVLYLIAKHGLNVLETQLSNDLMKVESTLNLEIYVVVTQIHHFKIEKYI